MHDAQIVELYWNKDELAIAESEKCYGLYCQQIAVNILTNHEDAEECVNDTWQKSWNSIPPQRPLSLAAFFGKIVRNLSISRFRANRAQKRFNGMTVLLSELDDCIPTNDCVIEAIEVSQLTELIERWLSLLTADDRALFVRRYWFGDAVNELARECGVTQNQMAQRMLRLRKGLKQILEREGFDV
jgi:RNA polymerase sigma-70 factor (ECF subfamily)